MKKHLPGMSDANWTSCLRHSAGFSSCVEGLSDFYYEGDMKTFWNVFNLGNDKKAYIEVKSITMESIEFKLSDRQFLTVKTPLASRLMIGATSSRYRRVVLDSKSAEFAFFTTNFVYHRRSYRASQCEETSAPHRRRDCG